MKTDSRHDGRGRRPFFELPSAWEALTGNVIGAAMDVHTALGPGLLERLYEDAMAHELGLRGISFQRQLDVVIPYKSIQLRGQRIDLIVENLVVVELKAVDAVADTHLAQLVSFMRASNTPLGLLINFNVASLKNGIYRRINERAFPPEIRIPKSFTTQPF
ncbi:MAG: GxxExxY protein [Phycisphaeraceae bacterium]|nr:MAG: GxxExxY protein [Phycisphaeraceae bacterium]